MITVRRSTFETNSSSTHSLNFISSKRKNYYDLTPRGYVACGFDEYFSESDKSVYYTFHDKLVFLLTMLKEIKADRENYKYAQVPREDFIKDKEFIEIRTLCCQRIPNCRGMRFVPRSFTEKGYVNGGMDSHHYEGCRYLSDYLKRNQVTLEQFLFSPNIVVCMNQ